MAAIPATIVMSLPLKVPEWLLDSLGNGHNVTDSSSRRRREVQRVPARISAAAWLARSSHMMMILSQCVEIGGASPARSRLAPDGRFKSPTHEEKHMLEKQYDVLIVGSGPAGAAAAQAIRGRGLDSVVIEKARLPRYKMCSGILFPSARKLIADAFGPLPKNVLSEPARVHGNRVYLTLEGPAAPAPFSVFDDGPSLGEDGLNVKRSELDHWLCRQSGVPIVDDCLFKAFRRDGDDLAIQLRQGSKDVETRTRYLVGADGTRSAVRRALSSSFERTLRLIPNYEEWYAGDIDLEPEWLYLFFDRTITGYFATVFHKDGNIIAATGTRRGEPVKECFRTFIAHLEERHGLAVERRVTSCGCAVHDMAATGNYCLGEGNVLLAGEAGGFNRCGEGISSALLTGQAAGESILRSIESGDSAFASYPDAVAGEIEACTRVNKLIEQAVGLNPFTRD
jgi:flavin-dependent dehydrogenase